MAPARKVANLDHTNIAKVNSSNIEQVIARPIAKYGALHVCSFELPAVHSDIALRRNDNLGEM
jgi:hypothetical protein